MLLLVASCPPKNGVSTPRVEKGVIEQLLTTLPSWSLRISPRPCDSSCMVVRAKRHRIGPCEFDNARKPETPYFSASPADRPCFDQGSPKTSSQTSGRLEPFAISWSPISGDACSRVAHLFWACGKRCCDGMIGVIRALACVRKHQRLLQVGGRDRSIISHLEYLDGLGEPKEDPEVELFCIPRPDQIRGQIS